MKRGIENEKEMTKEDGDLYLISDILRRTSNPYVNDSIISLLSLRNRFVDAASSVEILCICGADSVLAFVEKAWLRLLGASFRCSSEMFQCDGILKRNEDARDG